MPVSQHHTERFYLKLLATGFSGIVLLIAVFWGGHGLFLKWQEKRLIRRAMIDIAKGDDRAASLAARSVIEMKPTSVPAARVMAQLGERAGDRAALDWRRKVVQLEPQSVDDAIALARTALQFNDLVAAERALSGINEAGQQRADYHAATAMLANARQQEDKAESEWAEAARLAPNEKGYQLQLGTLLLHAHNDDRHAAGEAMLQALRDDPKYRVAATRALVNEGVARRESAQKLLDLARDLYGYPEATMSDRLIYLDFLHQLQDPQFASALTELEKSSADTTSDLAAVLTWMSQNNLNLLAIDFLKTTRPEILQQWPVPLAISDIDVRLKDWKELEKTTKDKNWNQFEFLRHAYLARADRGQDKLVAAEHEWAAASKAASAQPELVRTLVQLTSEWKWENETVELLWTLSKFPEKQNEALQTLYAYYSKNSDTEGLYRVLVRLFEIDSGNLNVENNLAQVSLLLNADPTEAYRLAADVYHKMPSNSAYVTTYAYSLLRKGDVRGAMKTMSALTPEQLHDPTISAYYGICLAATHDERARPFLEAGQQATALLPEEKALIDKALANLEFVRRAK
jgi:hypothetical protein